MADASKVSLPDFSDWKDRVEVISKLALGMLALAYVVGLIVLNLYLRRYGITYVNFLQIEYVMVGMLWSTLVALAYIALSFIGESRAMIFDATAEYSKWRRRFIRTLGLAIIITFSLAALAFCLTFASDFSLGFFEIPTIGGTMNLFATAWIIEHIYKDSRRTLVALSVAQEARRGFGPAGNAMNVGSNLFLFVTFLIGYSVLYPHLSPAFGGGSPQRVICVVKQDSQQVIRNLQIPVEPENLQSAEVDVIFEGPDFFIIVPPTAIKDSIKAVRIPKDSLQSIMYVRRNPS